MYIVHVYIHVPLKVARFVLSKYYCAILEIILQTFVQREQLLNVHVCIQVCYDVILYPDDVMFMVTWSILSIAYTDLPVVFRPMVWYGDGIQFWF